MIACKETNQELYIINTYYACIPVCADYHKIKASRFTDASCHEIHVMVAYYTRWVNLHKYTRTCTVKLIDLTPAWPRAANMGRWNDLIDLVEFNKSRWHSMRPALSRNWGWRKSSSVNGVVYTVFRGGVSTCRAPTQRQVRCQDRTVPSAESDWCHLMWQQSMLCPNTICFQRLNRFSLYHSGLCHMKPRQHSTWLRFMLHNTL